MVSGLPSGARGGGDPIDPCRSNPGCALNSIAMQTFYHNNTYRDGRASYNDDGAQGLPLPTYPQVKVGGGGGGGGGGHLLHGQYSGSTDVTSA